MFGEGVSRRAEIRAIEARLGKLERAMRRLDSLIARRPSLKLRMRTKLDSLREYLVMQLRDGYVPPSEVPVPSSRKGLEREINDLRQRLSLLTRDNDQIRNEAAALRAMVRERARGTSWAALPQMARRRKDCPIKCIEELRALRDQYAEQING